MSSPLDAELRQHARALRGLAQALVGRDDADDLLQDAALEVLRQPTAPVSLRAWLQRALRHLAGRRRRDAALRRQREAATSPQRQAPPTDRVAEHREALRRLDAALLALPEPYQGTLLLRYFEGLLPAAIAEQSGVPLATVKSRLQRGLQLLRQQLDADRADWRGALALAFGLERAGPVAATTTGVLLMTTAAKLVLAGTAAALVVAAWLLLQPAPARQPTATGQATTAAADAAEAARGEGSGLLPTADTQRQEIAAAAAGEGARPATLRGRCVDEQGAGLAGVRAGLSAGRTDGQHIAEEQWQDRSLTTAADGRFELRFPVLPHCHFTLELQGEDRCTCRASWFDLVPGQDVDLGNLLLPRALSIRGRVVDTAGAPVAGVEFDLQRDSRGEPARVVSAWPAFVDPSAADGTFAARVGAPAGFYWLRTKNREMAREPYMTFALDADHPALGLEVVVFREADRPPIRGVVVDEAGAPLWRADVAVGDVREATDRDGRFAVHPAGGSGPFTLEASLAGHETVRSGPHARGASELRIVLPTLVRPNLRVIVRAADTGQPIEDFSATLSGSISQRSGPSMRGLAPRRHWPHGIAMLADAAAGERAVYVDPGDGEHAPSGFVPVRIAGDTEVLIELARLVERRLRLRTDADAPLRARVELLDLGGMEAKPQSVALEIADWSKIEGTWKALLLQRGDTDETGQLLLRGPAGRDLALRLSGSDVALQFVQPIRLDAEGPLVLTPQRGGHWHGQLLPADVAAELFAASQAPAGARAARHAFGIALARLPEEELRTFFEPLFPYAADGRFAIDGIPAGTWTATVFAMGHSYPATTITVADGQTLEQDIDVSALRPVRAALQFFVGGKPLADASANLYGEHAAGTGARPMRTQYFLRTDAEGRVAFTTFAGRLGCELHGLRDGAAVGGSTAVLEVPAGACFEQVVDLRFGSVDLALLRPDGRPAAELEFQLDGVTMWPRFFRTDAEGHAALRELAVGSYRLRTRMPSLGEAAARDAYARQFGWQALQDAWLDVGTLAIEPDAAPDLRLRLPTDWDR